MSIQDLFRRTKPSPSLSPLLARPASCADISTPFHHSLDHTGDGLWLEKKHTLKRCATTAHATTIKSGWGIVPVLNELERRSSTHSLCRRRSPGTQQLHCLNCRRLYFPSDSRCPPQPSGSSASASASTSPSESVPPTEQFCSLDCKSSYACTAAMQNLVDLHLHAASTTSSDEDAVITVDDDSDFSL